MKILIVGAGIAGLAMARSLESFECDITIIEKQPSFSSVGFSFLIWPNGQRIIEDLGLTQVVSEYHVVPDYTIYNQQKEVLKYFKFSKLSHMPVKVKRKTLHEDLQSGLATKIQFGTWVSSIQEGVESVSVTLNNGIKKEFDLVIGADGIDSQLRKMIKGTKTRNFGWEGYMFWGPVCEQFPNDGVHQIWGREIFFGSFPHGGEQVVYYIGIPDKSCFKTDSKIQTLKNLLQELSLSESILSNIKSESEIYHSTTLEVPLGKLHSKRCVLIGDAAHGMPWAMGMGVTMAMEDVALLNQLLKRGGNILEDFALQRKIQLRQAYKLTGKMWDAIRCPRYFVPWRDYWVRGYKEADFIRKLEKIIS